MSSKVQVLFTCDVECSLGNCGTFAHPIFRPWPVDTWMWGQLGGAAQRWGVELLMDQLDRRGMKGTFYVSALEKHFHGEDALAEVVRKIEERGHEAGVHIHCAWKGFDTVDRRYDLTAGFHLRDSIGEYDEAEQRELLEEAVDCIRRWAGREPTSFRAGNFGADHRTLKLLSELGIATDSSCNAATGSLGDLGTTNSIIESEGLLEVPATTFEALEKPRRVVRFVDPTNMTLEEARRVFDQLADHDVSTLVLVTHSFQYVAPGHVRNAKLGPRPHIVERVDAILDILAEDSRFEPATMRSLAAKKSKYLGSGDGQPRIPAWITAARLLQSSADAVPRPWFF